VVVDQCSAKRDGDGPLPAGAFAAWLAGMQRALRGEQGSDVPCDGCTACCASSQFVHIGPDEVDSLAHIPPSLLFPAPRAPRGNVLMGYDEYGRCPMLGDAGCSIYEHRPRTCRTYDCRIFPATGVDLDDDGKPAIAERAGRWRFEYPAELDRSEHAALRAAAAFVREHEDSLPDEMVPATATQRAVLAIELHDASRGRPLEDGVEVLLSSLVRRGVEQSGSSSGS
jgi:Fe-S-cluster containining protein